MAVLSDKGARCALAECRQLDFLPFKCGKCEKTFCLNHFRCEAHACPKVIASDTNIPLLAKQMSSRERCVASGCREVLTASGSLKCPRCGRRVCLKHRFEDAHDCLSLASDASTRAPPAQLLLKRNSTDLVRSRGLVRGERPPDTSASSKSKLLKQGINAINSDQGKNRVLALSSHKNIRNGVGGGSGANARRGGGCASANVVPRQESSAVPSASRAQACHRRASKASLLQASRPSGSAVSVTSEARPKATASTSLSKVASRVDESEICIDRVPADSSMNAKPSSSVLERQGTKRPVITTPSFGCWRCTACTLINREGASVCDACGAKPLQHKDEHRWSRSLKSKSCAVIDLGD